MSASLPRRGLLIGAAGLAVAGCRRSSTMTASRTPELDVELLNREIGGAVERAKPGVLGFGLMNLESGQTWTVDGERRFPMQSVFKAALGAAALAEVDAGRLKLDEPISIGAMQLSPPYSPIAAAWPDRTVYTAGELLAAAVGDSDNTAADVLMKRVGGPGAVTAWLQGKRITEVRVDRYERELQPEAHGMGSFRADWRGPAFTAALLAVPAERRREAMAAYLRDPRDTATPRSMLRFLSMLDAGELLSRASTLRLVRIMMGAPRGADRLKAGFPRDSTFAHKIGSSGTDLGMTAAYNDVGILTLADRRSYAVAAFLSGSTAGKADRAALLAGLGRVVAKAVG